MFQTIKQIINDGRKFFITTHIDQDGDAIGSAFALYLVLHSLGKDAVVYFKDVIPYKYEFLPGPAAVLHQLPADTFDAVFVLDCGNFFRVGAGYEELTGMGTIINIDHHETNESFGTINIVIPQASSTGEILYGLIQDLGAVITPDIAMNIYTAILTDTGSFRYENTNHQAFIICEEMLRYGVSPSYVARMVYENHPKKRLLLLGMVLGTLKTYKEDTIAMASVTREMFLATDTNSEYSDGFVEFIREIRGVDIAIVARQLDDGHYKISMRSKDAINVALICNAFGGGGHRNAAGCIIDGSLEEVTFKIKEALGIR